MGFELLASVAEPYYPDLSKMYVRELFYLVFAIYGIVYFIAKRKGGTGPWETASRVVGAVLVLGLLAVVFVSMFGI